MTTYDCHVHGKSCEYPGVCINQRNIDIVRTENLDTVLWKYRQGFISTMVWEYYAHLWQTSAPRFEIRVCDCHECKANYGHLRLMG